METSDDDMGIAVVLMEPYWLQPWLRLGTGTWAAYWWPSKAHLGTHSVMETR